MAQETKTTMLPMPMPLPTRHSPAVVQPTKSQTTRMQTPM